MLLFLLLFLSAAAVAAPASSGPKVLLLLASGLSLDDLQRTERLPHVRELAEAGGAALLNTAVSGAKTESAAYLSVGASERLAAPDEAIAAQALRPDETGPEGDIARSVYRRRFGDWPPKDAALVHLGLPALARMQPSPTRAAQVGALGDALHQAGFRAAVDGDIRSVLVLMDRRGAVSRIDLPHRPTRHQMEAALTQADVLAITAQDAPTLDHFAEQALPLVRNLYVLVAVPAAVPGRLGFAAAAGPGIAARSLLVSPTTRTPGLAANIDVAPTALAWLDAPIPPGMGGQPITTADSHSPFDALALLDRQVTAARNATVPVLIGYGTFAIGMSLLSLVALLLRGSAGWARAAHIGLLLAAAALVAFLPVGVWGPVSPWLYGTAVMGISGLLVAAAIQVGRRLTYPPLGVLLIFTALVVVVDAVFGSVLVSRALLSGYFLPGIRFYGIGNEYMGLTVGAALVGPLLALAPPAPSRVPAGASNGAARPAFEPPCGRGGAGGEDLAPPLLPAPPAGAGTSGANARPLLGAGGALLWLLTLLAIGAPFWGADAGGAITAVVTFMTAVIALRTPRLRGERSHRTFRRLRARPIAAAYTAAILVVAAFALLDRVQSPENRSHVGAAVAAGQTRGSGVLVEIIARKAAMNIGLLLTPGAAAALAGLIPIWWLLGRGPLLARAADALEKRPGLRRALPAAAWGALTAFIFNDSGIVAALLLLAAPTVAVIDGILCDFSEWTMERGASALPSATPPGSARTR